MRERVAKPPRLINIKRAHLFLIFLPPSPLCLLNAPLLPPVPTSQRLFHRSFRVLGGARVASLSPMINRNSQTRLFNPLSFFFSSSLLKSRNEVEATVRTVVRGLPFPKMELVSSVTIRSRSRARYSSCVEKRHNSVSYMEAMHRCMPPCSLHALPPPSLLRSTVLPAPFYFHPFFFVP